MHSTKLFPQSTNLGSNLIVHRDIKEDNIVVDPQTNRLTLIDFGMAQQCVPDNQGRSGNIIAILTPTGNTWGNLGTIPPEVMAFIGNSRGSTQLFSLSITIIHHNLRQIPQ
ncbi:hypothetical protein Pelo_14767 [Pelomyxa schiedti]|nr:hypothetical protein Pelo_14767 [Pelomyxa schiedti]